MGENSKIEWTDHTFNPWVGCQKVSPGCDHCYAEALMDTRYRKVQWGPHGERKRTSDANWKLPLRWEKAARERGVRARVFCASLADWLDNQVPRAWRADLWALIEATPHLDWLLLTKRIENYAKLAPWHIQRIPRNVWLGITAEDQEHYRRRWAILSDIPASVRFISYEPALGPVLPGMEPDGILPDWIIAGGESGPNARPPHPDWFRRLRDDCERLGIAFLFKQWGEFRPCRAPVLEWSEPDGLKNAPITVLPDAGTPDLGTQTDKQLRRAVLGKNCAPMARVGKRAAGRLLDGIEHNGFPKVAA